MVAWACGQRSMTAWIMPGRLMSKLYFARPVDLAGPSRRGGFLPMRRRFSGQAVAMSQPPLLLGAQGRDGVAHLGVSAAATDVAGQRLPDPGRGGVGVLVEGRAAGDEESGRAEAALLGVGGDEGGRDGVELAAVHEGLGGLDRLALGLEGEDRAGVDRLAVEQDGARAAGTAVADALAAGDVEVV